MRICERWSRGHRRCLLEQHVRTVGSAGCDSSRTGCVQMASESDTLRSRLCRLRSSSSCCGTCSRSCFRSCWRPCSFTPWIPLSTDCKGGAYLERLAPRYCSPSSSLAVEAWPTRSRPSYNSDRPTARRSPQTSGVCETRSRPRAGGSGKGPVSGRRAAGRYAPSCASGRHPCPDRRARIPSDYGRMDNLGRYRLGGEPTDHGAVSELLHAAVPRTSHASLRRGDHHR
jgi:hypothetical protein